MAENEKKALKFFWKIENYSYFWNRRGEFLRSPDFHMDVYEGSSWCLKLCSTGVSPYENYISIHLERQASSSGPLGITVDYEIALLRSDGAMEYMKESKNRCFRKGHAFGFYNLAAREEILGTKKSVLLPEDILTVQCSIFPKETQLKSCTEIIARTHLEVERFVFLWESKNNFSIRCNEFNSVQLLNDRKPFCMKLYWTYVDQIQYLAIYFSQYGGIKIFHCKLGILDANGLVSRCLVDKHHDFRRDKTTIYLIPADEISKQKSLYLQNDKLTFHCDLTFHFGVQCNRIEVYCTDNTLTFVPAKVHSLSEVDTPTKDHSYFCPDSPDSFKNDFQILYQEGTLSDFSLKVGNETIQAHKAVLGARSPVFKAMLTSNMKEIEKNMAIISDLEVDTVRSMLKFMYTDKVDDHNWDTASKLYVAADKYAIMKLKCICSNVLKRNLCVSNIGEALVLANSLGDDDLKDLTLEFISNHDTEVICSAEWKAFMTEEIQLAAESMHHVFMKKAEKNRGQT